MSKYAAILLAAGRSSRFKHREKKPFAPLDGRAVWLRSLELFSVREDFRKIVIAISPEDRDLFDLRFRSNVAFIDVAQVIDGGAERTDSVRIALEHVPQEIDYVAIHDTARACLTAELLTKVLEGAEETGAATLATPVVDTIKREGPNGIVTETVPREGLWLVQTPQVFRRELIVKAYANRPSGAPSTTDDCMLVEAIGGRVQLVESDSTNFKITTAADLALAEAVIRSRPEAKPKSFHPFADEKMW
jgi:2-C-methyl-D-erythritol 4-phosphate cytidylyltransferase